MNTTEQFVQYGLQGQIATIRIDDGKRNALSPAVLNEIYQAFDRAEADGATVILTGRESVLSAGFDLNVMKRGGLDAIRMLRAGYALTARLMEYPYPIVTACNGHALAMGVFMMLSTDYIIGSRGDFKISANEVAIGLTMPRAAALTLRHRLTPAAFQRAVNLSEYFDVDAAMNAGFFDELVEPAELAARAEACAIEFAELDTNAHKASKRRIRASTIRKIRRGIPLDLIDAAIFGMRRSQKK